MLSSNNKDIYRALCDKEPSLPVFSRDWWLDIVCREKWTVLLFEEKGCIRATFPLYIPASRIISMPPYTQTMGIWFAPEASDAKYSTIIANRQAICKSFAGEIKDYSSFLQNFSYDLTDWLPFYWEGYAQTTRYTYLLDNIADRDRLKAGMSANIRRNITKAKEKYRIKVSRNVPVADFMRLMKLTFERQNLEPKHITILENLIETARKRNQGDVWGGYDESGNLHSVAFVVWQKSSAYYIAGGSDPALRHSGAHSLTLWEAICEVAPYTGRFDFEGSMLQGVERFFREFGGVQTPYFAISKGKPGLLDRFRIRTGL